MDGDFDCLVHLAAFKIPRYGKAIDTCASTIKVLTKFCNLPTEIDCKCVLASTSDVYGRNPQVPFNEDDESVIGSSKVARWAYAVSKLFDEHLALAYQDSYGIPVTLLRFFGSYGPRQHLTWWGGPQSVFIDAVLNEREIPLHGDGLQTRSFTYVSDTVEGIYAAAMNPAANGEILNIGSTHEITILDLAQIIHRSEWRCRRTPYQICPVRILYRKAYEDVRRRVPDVTRCEQILGSQGEGRN